MLLNFKYDITNKLTYVKIVYLKPVCSMHVYIHVHVRLLNVLRIENMIWIAQMNQLLNLIGQLVVNTNSIC